MRMLYPNRKSPKPISLPEALATTRGGMTMLSNETVRKLQEMLLGVMAEAFSTQLQEVLSSIKRKFVQRQDKKSVVRQ